MASQKMSLEMTSSFFCSSPDSFVESAKPTSPRIGAVATRLLMRLHATAIELMITARSASMCPACSWRNIQVDKVSAPTREDAACVAVREGNAALFPDPSGFAAAFSARGGSGGAAASVFSRKSTSSGEPR